MRPIDGDELRKEVGRVILEIADTPIPNDYASKLAVKLCDLIQKKIEEAPTVDTEPVRHGKWMWADDGYLRCSKCTQKAPTTTQYQNEPIQTETSYCPNCGAKMDGDEDATD